MPYTPQELFTAASQNDFKSVEKILATHPDFYFQKINTTFKSARDKEGNSVLHWAVFHHNADMVEAILSVDKEMGYYSNLNLSTRKKLFLNHKHQNPLHILFTKPYCELNQKILRLFGKYKSFFFMKNAQGETPAYLALKDSTYHDIILEVLRKSHRYLLHFLHYPAKPEESLLNLLINLMFSVSTAVDDKGIIELVADAFKAVEDKKLSHRELSAFEIAQQNVEKQLQEVTPAQLQNILLIFCKRNLKWTQKLYNTVLQSMLLAASTFIPATAFSNEHQAIMEVCARINIWTTTLNPDQNTLDGLAREIEMLEQALEQAYTNYQADTSRPSTPLSEELVALEKGNYNRLKDILKNAALQLASSNNFMNKVAEDASLPPAQRWPMLNQHASSAKPLAVSEMPHLIDHSDSPPSKRVKLSPT